MNYTQLQQAILDDTHKPGYAGEPIQRFIVQAEALIATQLEAYNFLATLTDTERVSAGSSTYNLPARLSQLRYVRIDGRPLDKVDETSAYLMKDSQQSLVYAQRASQIIIAGNPAAGTSISIDYMGMPTPLATTPTNTLLDEYPMLYQHAASIYVFSRAEDYDSVELHTQQFASLVRQINRKMKKLLGGAQAVGPYNVNFRSSY